MEAKLTMEQVLYCVDALDDICAYGKTERTCPICGKPLKAEGISGTGTITCETKGCFGKITTRGI